MALGIYKRGQGYWVRVLTAVFALVIIAVGCAWLGKSLGAVDLPMKSWTMTVNVPSAEVPAELAAGRTLTLIADPVTVGARGPEIGTAEVESVAPSPIGSGREVTVRKLAFNKNADATQIKSIAGTSGGPVVATVVGQPRGKPVFELLYIQAGGVAVLVLLGAIAVYWFVGARATTVDFLIATDGEMKKVNWSTRKDIIGSTKVVIIWCVLLVAGLFLVDLAFSTFFRLIGVLQT